ncbi:MarR family winged helix-turn-helix transcriptional regulator [Noviherbaspirillum pedocola]|uniref:MarR family transcriptional regulator n=1 Tax=Noviherbaspirillum pedocola TaxID=2801341 RepID=A0A934W869_9BURK|nr:MarR family transcriptional regulator [Noviherbaspirillum pedocola]MBK4735474.1 MarR family transcriptional regulator [Noviherbaspirillum pedocola]
MSKNKTASRRVPVLQEQLCFALYSASLAMTKVYRPLLQELGITYPQYLVLMLLWEQDERTVSELGEPLLLDSATLTPLLKRMEAAGLVTRSRSRSDERQVVIGLTDEGAAMKEHAKRIMAAVIDATGCSNAELAQMKNDLIALRDRLVAQAQ